MCGEGNGTPLQYSCLENPRDGGAWWAAIYGVTQSRTRLKRLSSSSSSRDCHIECSQWEKQISYINSYMWNLEKWYRWSYLQNRNTDIDVENKCVAIKGGKEGRDELGDWDWHIYTIDTVYKIDNYWEPTVQRRGLYSELWVTEREGPKKEGTCV